MNDFTSMLKLNIEISEKTLIFLFYVLIFDKQKLSRRFNQVVKISVFLLLKFDLMVGISIFISYLIRIPIRIHFVFTGDFSLFVQYSTLEL